MVAGYDFFKSISDDFHSLGINNVDPKCLSIVIGVATVPLALRYI